jgi:uncharacterized protein involved in exopolysaccharide biosynthesis
MVNRESILKQDKVEFKSIVKVFVKMKWWFISSVGFTLILGLIYTFLYHKDYLFIYNIAASVFFSIIIGLVVVIAADFFLSPRTSGRS